MSKIKIYSLLAISVAAFVFTSCDKTDGTSVVPRFDKITYEPELPSVGDSITLTAHQSMHGKLINSTTYKWSVTYYNDATGRDTTEYLPQQEVVYDYIGGPDPQIGYRIPATTSRKIGVHISAFYSLSGQTELGQIFGQANCSGSINLK